MRPEDQRKAQVVVERLQEELPNWAFMLIGVDARGRGGFLTWMSNAQRHDMIKLLRELIERLEAGTADTAGREA